MTAPALLPSSRRKPPPSSGVTPPVVRPSGFGRWLARLHWASMDAVLVVLTYAWALARGAGIRLPWPVYAFLALGIWLGYTADRLADLERIPSRAQRTGRHAFHLRHRSVLTTVWVGGFLGGWPLAWVLLPFPVVLAGGSLAAAAALYVWWGSGISGCGGSWSSGRDHRKRRFTALLLTMAGVWSLWAGGGGFGPPVGVLVGVFAVAAWWNLALLGSHRRSPWRVRDGGPAPGPMGNLPRGRPRGSILAAALLLVLPLWSGALVLLPGAAVLVLGLGGLSWGGVALSEDALPLAADGTLALGFLVMGVALALVAG